MSLYGFGFLGHNVWNPAADNQHGIFGAAAFIYGTAVTSAIALLLAGPIGIAIGLYLSLLAPRRVAAVIGPLIELIAAVPSVVLGLWGLLVLAPLDQVDDRAGAQRACSAGSRCSARPPPAGPARASSPPGSSSRSWSSRSSPRSAASSS